MVHVEYMYISSFWEVELENVSAKKIEQNYLDGSTFATVFPGAKHAGATVLYMQHLTHDISFNDDLWHINHETKQFVSY